MATRKKRKPDMRRIGRSQTYTIPQLAKAVHRRVETVRRWYRQGMPSLGDEKPLIFDGAEVKAWLRRKWDSKKQPCAENEAYCVKCHARRLFRQGTASRSVQSQKTAMLTGKCNVCGTTMNKFQSAIRAARTEPLPGRSRDGYAA